MFLCSVWYPFLCGGEAFFVVSNKEVEWVEVLVAVSSRENTWRNHLAALSNSCEIVDLISKFLEGIRTVHSTQERCQFCPDGTKLFACWED